MFSQNLATFCFVWNLTPLFIQGTEFSLHHALQPATRSLYRKVNSHKVLCFVFTADFSDVLWNYIHVQQLTHTSFLFLHISCFLVFQNTLSFFHNFHIFLLSLWFSLHNLCSVLKTSASLSKLLHLWRKTFSATSFVAVHSSPLNSFAVPVLCALSLWGDKLLNTCTAFAHTTLSSQLLPFIGKTAFPLFPVTVVLARQNYTRNEGLLNITAFERCKPLDCVTSEYRRYGVWGRGGVCQRRGRVVRKGGI